MQLRSAYINFYSQTWLNDRFRASEICWNDLIFIFLTLSYSLMLLLRKSLCSTHNPYYACCRWLIWPIQNDAKNLIKYWNPSTRVPIWEYSVRAIQWIPKWQGLKMVFKKPCVLVLWMKVASALEGFKCRRVSLATVVWIYDTLGNNFQIKNDLTKYFKESCC